MVAGAVISVPRNPTGNTFGTATMR